MSNKKIVIKKHEVTGLVFEINVIDGKKWVKFVAMQKNSATLIYDGNTMKVTLHAEFALKKSTAIQNSTVPNLKTSQQVLEV